MYATIEPVSIWQGKTAQQGVSIDALVIVIPNRVGRVEWRMCNAAGQPIAQGIEEMVGEDYDAWGADDAHVFRWLADKLGLTIVEITEPPPPAEPAPPMRGEFVEPPAN